MVKSTGPDGPLIVPYTLIVTGRGLVNFAESVPVNVAEILTGPIDVAEAR